MRYGHERKRGLMDQIKIFATPEERAYEDVKPAMLGILAANGLGEEYLSIEEKKSYYSVYFDKLRIHSGKKPYIEMPANGAYIKISLTDLSEISKHIARIKNSLESVIDNIAKDFDCCHRFEECSDAKVCTNPDKKMALKCGYRKILKSGRIFYGKNRNVQ